MVDLQKLHFHSFKKSGFVEVSFIFYFVPFSNIVFNSLVVLDGPGIWTRGMVLLYILDFC